MRISQSILLALATTMPLAVQPAKAEKTGDHTAAAVRAEALRPNRGPEGRPLPLAAHWHRNSMPLSWQIEQIRRGRHLLPWIPFHRRQSAEQVESMAEEIALLAEWKLPFVLLTGGQWEADFYRDERYKELPADRTGVGVSLKGNRIKAVSPLSPVEPWHKLGREWTDIDYLRKFQEFYPDPPRVLFVSNNEATDVRWHKAEQLQRFVERHGDDTTDNFKRRVFGDGWIERYGAMFEGMRQGLDDPTWRRNSRFVGYNAFGPDHFARWDGWVEYSLHTDDRVTWAWHAWDGGIPEAYDNHWEPGKKAYNVWSMQTEMMNLVFMKDEAFAANPDYWHEVIFWDGFLPDKNNDKRKQYAEEGIARCTPELYRGWTQYVMWTLVPRVAREWRASTFDKENWLEYFDQIVKSVDRVHANPVLTRFWRHGELVPNRSRPHPFQASIPEKWRNVDRWFHLNTNLDPDSWALDQQVPVYTLARVIGGPGRHEWLLYAHAPMGDRHAVQVTIPDYRTVTVDAAVGGSFYLVREADDSVTRIAD